MQIILFLFFISFSAITFGQQVIHGKILSAIDDQPVPYFKLQVGKKHYIISDSLGSFRFSTDKKKLRVRFAYTMTEQQDTLLSPDPTKPLILRTINTWDSTQAKYDIEIGQMRLFCCFGFLVLAPGTGDRAFESRYGIKYYVAGDAPPAPVERLAGYNDIIMKYLDKKFGPAWRNEIGRPLL